MSRPSYMRALLTASALCCVLPAMPALAQEADKDGDRSTIIVNAEREIPLDSKTETGSRLGLSLRETPATVDVLTQERFLERGLRTSNEALNSAPGVTAMDTGGSPGTVSMRGFGGNSVSHNYDGVHQPSTMNSRDFDSFAFDRIEVLKGPASVLFGEGAIGGAVNFVPKKPMLGVQEVSALAQYGSNDTFRVAGDVNVPVSGTAALRGIVSYAGSDGFLERTDSESLSANLGLTWQPSTDLTVFLAAEYFWKDDGAIYWGTPLVGESVARNPSDLVTTENGLVLDLALRDINFQFENAKIRSDSTWLRSQVVWQMDDVWTLRNDLSYNNGDRLWDDDASGYRFVAATGLVNRGGTYIRNLLDFWQERLTLSSDGPLFGHRNRFLIGVEHSENSHMSLRRFTSNELVDPYAFVPGNLPPLVLENFPGAGNFADSAADTTINAVFAENAFNVTDRLLLVVGGRYEDMKLKRTVEDYNLDTITAYDKTYNPFSYRAGAVYDLADKTQVFAQYTRAAAAVGTMVLMSLSNTNYKLTTGESAEIGIKSSFLADRISMTLSGYWLRQKDIITRDPSNPNVSIQGGAQSSRGIELALSAAVTRQFRLDGNLAVVDAEFDELIEAGGADRSGNTPPNVEDLLVNLFAVYEFDQLPVKLTAGMRHSSDTFADNANTIRVNGYTIFDASIGYRFAFGDLTLRGRNLTDRTFIVRGGSSTVYLGAPRTVDLTFRTRF